MIRAIVLIDGEHYPPVVRFALAALSVEHEVLAAVFIGGSEKVDASEGLDAYGVPLVVSATAEDALVAAIDRYDPCMVVDLSDEPVVSSADRFRLAGIALARNVEYRGADFHFTPPRACLRTVTPTLGLIGTAKRVGKTALAAYVARHQTARGRDVVVLAMGRGGPSEPELIRGDEVKLTTADLFEFVRQGKHASSDNVEDAIMSRVTTVGCRRCGGGMAGETFFSNVPEGARLADSLGKDLLVLEGSGAAIPPVHADATILVVGAAGGVTYVRDYFGPFRLGRADGVIVAGAEEPNATPDAVAEIIDAVRVLRSDVPISAVTFRPSPIEPVGGARVFFATTAPPAMLEALTKHLESEHGCTVVGSSPHLSNRALLRKDMELFAGRYDVLLTELKAAAIDVVAAAGAQVGVPTVLCDNVPVPTDGSDLDALLDDVTAHSLARGAARGGQVRGAHV